MVVPYLSIIEQTARIYRDIFETEFGPHYVLEHHSLARKVYHVNKAVDAKTENPEGEDEISRLLSENWDAR